MDITSGEQNFGNKTIFLQTYLFLSCINFNKCEILELGCYISMLLIGEKSMASLPFSTKQTFGKLFPDHFGVSSFQICMVG